MLKEKGVGRTESIWKKQQYITSKTSFIDNEAAVLHLWVIIIYTTCSFQEGMS